jgi:hypothetical protein
MLSTKNTKMLISMPANLAQDISDFSKELNQNKSAIVSQALEFYFDHLDLKIAKQRSLEKNQTLSLDELRRLSDEQI